MLPTQLDAVRLRQNNIPFVVKTSDNHAVAKAVSNIVDLSNSPNGDFFKEHYTTEVVWIRGTYARAASNDSGDSSQWNWKYAGLPIVWNHVLLRRHIQSPSLRSQTTGGYANPPA